MFHIVNGIKKKSSIVFTVYLSSILVVIFLMSADAVVHEVILSIISFLESIASLLLHFLLSPLRHANFSPWLTGSGCFESSARYAAPEQ